MNKEFIIKKSSTFDEIINKCPSKKSKDYILFYRPKQLETAKYGIAAPKKLGKAVIRNKMKRRTRAIISEYQKNYKNNYDCIIIIRKSSLDKEYLELKEELFNLLLKINNHDSVKSFMEN